VRIYLYGCVLTWSSGLSWNDKLLFCVSTSADGGYSDRSTVLWFISRNAGPSNFVWEHPEIQQNLNLDDKVDVKQNRGNNPRKKESLCQSWFNKRHVIHIKQENKAWHNCKFQGGEWKSKFEAVRRHQNMHNVIKSGLILRAKEKYWRVLNSGMTWQIL